VFSWRAPAEPGFGRWRDEARLPLRGLDPDGRYSIRDLDRPGTTEATGRELLERGVPVAVEARPGAVVIAYRKL